MARRRPQKANPAREMVLQISVGIATAVVSSVLAAVILDGIRARRANASLPQGVAPGHGTA